ncbi:class I SAM-dependent methyltransferase [Paenibacillus sp. YPG26]|uniref:class I SAM-dependent methyltransferase n=1 Tax=Paenibacillus sp. YPG26 TaxID=2878915 RepID=UPI00203BDC1F|nr:class I SAM-dependent methyltransferase [Paenibacillus sp. YPG26]USB32322.1 class I SAM-dependent methyltransferase [Paenibacillus sp. YPG26]
MGNTEIFEAMAHKYDTPERIEIATMAANAIREYFDNGKVKSGIDFGCGTGLVGLNLLDDLGHIVFLDTSANMLELVDHKLTASGIQNAETVCFDFEAGLSSDLHADYIFMAQVLLHIRDVEPVLSRLYEVLNPGGHLIIVDFDLNEQVASDIVHNGFDQSSLKSLMTKIGFTTAASKTIYTGSKIFMNQDASMFLLDAEK